MLYDDNKVTIDGPTSWTFSEDVPARFRAQGWQVESIDGEDVAALDRALVAAHGAGRPALVVLRTTIGFGSPWAGQSKVHGGPFGEEVARATKQKLGIPESPTFLVPDDVRAYCAERVAAKRAERAAADAQLAKWRSAQPDAAKRWDAARTRARAGGFRGAARSTGSRARPTPRASTRARRSAASRRWRRACCSAARPTSPARTTLRCRASGAIGQGDEPFAGCNVNFGVREHAMAAITNGIALDGSFLPYAGTFLVFSDYMRPSLRLAALMRARSTFVFTHDSIFVGEDGPTHQPIEQLDALRAIPGLTVIRPADAIEAALAWAWIVQRAKGPVALALSRQTRARAEARGAVRAGAGVARRVHGARLERRARRRAARIGLRGIARLRGRRAAVERRHRGARDFGAEPRVARGAARGLPRRAAPGRASARGRRGRDAARAGAGSSGREGLVYGIERFGASAPYKKLAEHFGFTPDALAKRVREHLRG